ncbi:MAG: hypothetical protein DDT32_01159 [Syntrophomonadaceae bacterium]|nr:hypothetical protein [Bacillota bacterium]MBT9147404.1 hypothetical protein [Bacillota bacterium]
MVGDYPAPETVSREPANSKKFKEKGGNMKRLVWLITVAALTILVWAMNFLAVPTVLAYCCGAAALLSADTLPDENGYHEHAAIR